MRQFAALLALYLNTLLMLLPLLVLPLGCRLLAAAASDAGQVQQSQRL